MPTKMTSSRRSLILSTGTALLITALLLATGLCIYENNDDMAMIRLLSGQQGITAGPDAVFMALPLSSLLYLLYKLFPALPWYGMTMYAALIIGCTIGLRVIIEAVTDSRSRFIVILAFLGFYISIATRLNFASVSLFLWFCVCARIALSTLIGQPHDFRDWLCGCLMGFSYLVRPDIIQTVAIMFSLPLVAVLWLFPCKKRVYAVFTPVVITIIIVAAWSQAVRSTPEYTEFAKFNKVRGLFTDTTMSALNDRTMQAIASVGWSEVDYALASQHWWFHDGNLFSSEKTEAFLQRNNVTSHSLFNYRTGFEYLLQQKNNLLITLMCLAALMVTLPPVTATRNRQPLITGALAVTVLLVPLLAMVRFPPRVALPVFVCLILSAAVFRPYLTLNIIKSVLSSWCVWGLFCVIAMTLSISNIKYNILENISLRESKRYSDQSILEIQKLIGTNVIFLNASLTNAAFGSDNVSPLLEYRAMVPFICLPAGWLISSQWDSAFLKAHGLIDRKRLVAGLVNNPDIILSFWDTAGAPFYQFHEIFQRHLQDHYGSQFPDATIKLTTVLDRRQFGRGAPIGMIFFTINAVKTDGIKSTMSKQNRL